MGAEFLLTTLVVVATPGTGVVYTVASGVSRGRVASLWAAVGCTLGIVPHMLAAITGLAALLHASAVAFNVVKYLGVAYLLVMAFMLLRERGALVLPRERETTALPAARIVGSAVLINLLNPKLTIFFLAFLPQFVGGGGLTAMVGLSVVFMLVTFAVFVAYGLFAAAARDHVLSRPRVMRWLHRTFAGAFVLLGARLATAQR